MICGDKDVDIEKPQKKHYVRIDSWMEMFVPRRVPWLDSKPKVRVHSCIELETRLTLLHVAQIFIFDCCR